VPTEKRARKRAAREAKIAARARAQRRRATIRRGITLVVLVGLAVGIYVLVSGGGSKSPKVAAGSHGTSTTVSSTRATSTTVASTTTTTLPAAQVAADNASAAAGCPPSPKTPLTKTTYKSPPAMTIDTSKTYTATVKTDVGTFVMTLDPKTAPIAVNSFVFLAQKGFFNCIIFHRVIPGFVVQGGDPTGTGTGGPGYEFTEMGPPAATNSAQQYPLGSVAMANSSSGTTDPSTNGSQFFIVTGSQGEALPPDYVLFGQVTSGMSVVDQISNDGSASGVPPTITHRMLTVTVAES
jgi:cyclophilin family peptidyl-prolyl cis-trans isomerase